MRERQPVNEDEQQKTLARVLSDNAEHAESIVKAPGLTIRPAKKDKPGGPSVRPPPPPLPRPTSGLEIGKTIGQGGMGVVRLAKQRVLDRDVAVKTIQPKLASDAATRMLLQEALVLGRLEHPSIVPIYDIQYEGNEPRIVLKKIEGTEWRDLMRDAAKVKKQFGEDLLDWNLRILMQVCNAIHFAHSRGIVHRDLKPENIMIGAFGEMYVMDWGLGLALDDDGTGRFALARDATQLAGTPQYMAPEMLGGGTIGRISERTDVYLLGAILYEIITGQAPHLGHNLQEMMAKVLRSHPPLPDDCPPELARICRMAMDPDPGWRHESAEELRLAISRFLQHAGSRRLEAQARKRTDELMRLLAQNVAESTPRPGQSVAAIDQERSDVIQNLFGECRFAYRQALEMWPENEAARTGLTLATTAMIEHELAQHNPRSAANLMARLEDVEPALRDRVNQALAEAENAEKRMADLEHFRKQNDVQTGTRNRAMGALGLGIAWTVSPLLGPLFFNLEDSRQFLPDALFITLVLIAIAIWSWVRREDMRESGVTRRLMWAAALAMFVQLFFDGAALALNIDVPAMQVLWPLIWFTVSAMLVITVDARLLPMTLGFLMALVIGLYNNEWRFYGMALSNLIMTFNMFFVWMPLSLRKR